MGDTKLNIPGRNLKQVPAMMTAGEIRQTFLRFFKEKQHKIVASAPIVLKNDPTLMFTNAGMNQFKDIFLGNKKIESPRVADTQKCLRVSGKHNDLEEVGVDTYHHTMFEMLGNWSFGDYFKKESIAWGWELLTEVYKLDPERLYVTVFEGDASEKLSFDQEAFDAWCRHISKERILNGNKKDNFWEMGDTGPCGPCSEIHYDMRSDEERKNKDGKELVNANDPQVIEIWNHVFIQFNRKADGSLVELPDKHVDTGMGFERLVRALQQKSSNYDTDIFMPLISRTEELSGLQYTGGDGKTDIAFRVIADHIRAVSFCIADGQLPGNTGAGYVIKRILRRAIRYGYSFLHFRKPFFYELVSVLADQMKDVFPELHAQKDFVGRVIMEEENSFLKTLDSGIKKFNEVADEMISNQKNIFPGTIAFELYDTNGFPLDLTKLMATEKNLSVDEVAYQTEMEKQKSRSRKSGIFEQEEWEIDEEFFETKFVGYQTLESISKIMQFSMKKRDQGFVHQLVLDKTPFFAESGGQVGDIGTLEANGKIVNVINTKKENGLIVHYTDKPLNHLRLEVVAKVDENHRRRTEYNHTATHLLHAALRNVLGTHVQQKGSYVGPDRLRFDFSHFSKVTDDEIREIEKIVNAKIRENVPVEIRYMGIEEASKLGAMMLFGEKYGEIVRVVIADEQFSKELCGGTHVKSTGNIGSFKIITETAVAAGIRRVEAITGDGAEQYLYDQTELLKKISGITKSTGDVLKSVNLLSDENARLQKEIEKYQLMQLQLVRSDLINTIEKNGNIQLIRQIVQIENAELIKKLAFDLRNEIENLFCVLGAEIDGKANLTIIISDALVNEYKFDAGQLVRDLGKLIQGGGGGQKFYASAGGKNPGGLKDVMSKIPELLQVAVNH